MLLFLNNLARLLKEAPSIEAKSALLDACPNVQAWKDHPSWIFSFMESRSLEEKFVIQSIVAIEQFDPVFTLPITPLIDHEVRLDKLLKDLVTIERFYKDIGGIVGYHALVLEILSSSLTRDENISYHIPRGMDATHETVELRRMVIEGIAKMPEIVEICPVGGSADRLGLYDEEKGHFLPAARLPFLGKSLLGGIVVDVQALEYLHYKIYGRATLTPLALMTSEEKNNHEHIIAICEENKWFFRPKESFFLFCQPSVPLVDRKGRWCMQGPLQLILKPGGHGVIWKLACDKGVFSALKDQGRKKALIRQINNPMASIDNGLLAFIGMGFDGDRSFGFISCPRQEGFAEGINVLAEKPEGYTLTNIEYCDFVRRLPTSVESFPANTNILFADLEAVSDAVSKMPFPGVTLNFREDGARLESTMQNIADAFIEKTPYEKMFLMHNKRSKTISTTKRRKTSCGSLHETPEGCFLDFMHNARVLLTNHCGMHVDPEPFSFLYHPALGPLYEIIARKLRKGVLKKRSELQLHLAEADIENLYLDGSLQIWANQVMGHLDDQGMLCYSERVGRCTLRNVKIINAGIDFSSTTSLWSNVPRRMQTCKIILKGSSALYAENITLLGDVYIEVEDGEILIIEEREGVLEFIREPISTPKWHWKYTVGVDYRILMERAALQTATPS